MKRRHEMDGRMRRYAPQASPDRNKVWMEPPRRHHLTEEHHQRGKIPVVYYLCRNRHLEHPHFIQVPLSSPEGLYLRDVIDRLNVLRGKKMAAMYSWSCKRSYKNGFVWHDLSEDDLIQPAQGNEYVLKGSELLDKTPPDRNNHGMNNANVQYRKPPPKDPPPAYSKRHEASCSSSYMGVVIKETKLTPRSPVHPIPSVIQEDELSISTRQFAWSANISPEPDRRRTPPSAIGSPNPMEYKICNPVGAQDASTQTDEQGGRRTSGLRSVGFCTSDGFSNVECNGSQTEQSVCLKAELEIVKGERSPPSAISSDSSFGKINTLESLMRDEVKRRNNFRLLESEEFFLPTVPKLKVTNMLMNLITCGATSVKDHYGFGFVPTYRPWFTDTHITSPMSANSMVLEEINCLPESQREMGIRLKKKEHIGGSIIETNKSTEQIGGLSTLEHLSSFDDGRSCNMPYLRSDTKNIVDSAQSKCRPRNIKIQSCRHSRNDQDESVMFPASDTRNSYVAQDNHKSSPLIPSIGGSKRNLDGSSVTGPSMRLESFRNDKEKVIKIEESLHQELGL